MDRSMPPIHFMIYTEQNFTYYMIESEHDGNTTYIWYRGEEDELTIKRETVDTDVFNTIVDRNSGIYGLDFHASLVEIMREQFKLLTR